MRNSTCVVAVVAGFAVAACGGGNGSSSGPVGPTSVGDGSGGSNGGGGGTGGSGGPGGGGEGGAGGGMGGGGAGGTGGAGGGGGGAACDPAGPIKYAAGVLELDGSSHAAKPRMVADGGYVYYVTDDRMQPYPYAVARIGAGGNQQRIGSFGPVSDDNWFYDFAVDGRYVYVMNEGDVFTNQYGGFIDVYEKSGAFVRHIDPPVGNDCSWPIIGGVTAVGGTVFWDGGYTAKERTVCTLPGGGIYSSADPTHPLYPDEGGRLADDGSHLFWGNFRGVYRAPLTGGTPEKLADLTTTRDLALGGDVLYLLDSNRAVQTITAPGSWHAIFMDAGALAADAAHVYVTTTISGHPAVVRMNPDGSGQTELTTPDLFLNIAGIQQPPEQLAVDDTRVYFHLSDEGTVVSVCK